MKKRKAFLVIGIVLGDLVLLFILAVPAAPLWARLGVKPFYITGEWPHLRIVSGPPGAARSTAASPSPLASEGMPIPIIFDDDGSPDGVIALLFFLHNPLFDVKAVTVSCGEAHPGLFARHILKLLAGLGRGDIPVGAGRETPQEGNNVFPDPWRQGSDAFWDVALPPAAVSRQPVPAAALIVDSLSRSTQPVMVFVSGGHTNLAEALQREPSIAKRIRAVYIMGGSFNVGGNIESDWPAIKNRVAEWNIWVDPEAARQIFAAGLPLHIIPLDATRKSLWTSSDSLSWASSGSLEGKLAARLLEWMLRSWAPDGVFVWDLVAAVHAADPSLCPGEPLPVDVLVAPGPDQGRTVRTTGPPNAVVWLEPDAEQIKAHAAQILGH
jgi:purine nucleosidase/pyrimidine-specific ribonucleoside hydrolase